MKINQNLLKVIFLLTFSINSQLIKANLMNNSYKNNNQKSSLENMNMSTMTMTSLFTAYISNLKTNSKNLGGLKQVTLTTDELGSGPIFCEGWNKYLTYEYGSNSEPSKKFEFNEEYEKLKEDKKEENQEKIPHNENEFYFQANQNYLNAYTSKLVILNC
jgi:hypothetical protein